jgi:hypothetical protein
MIGTDHVIPLYITANPYRGFQQIPDPGLRVHQVEKGTFHRDRNRELSGQAGYSGKREGRESFSQCYTRVYQGSKHNSGHTD